MKKFITIAILFLLILSAQGQSIESLLKQRVESGDSPGIGMAIFENSKVTYYVEGYANPVTKEKVTSKTLFEIGSITKTFTTTAIAIEVGRGKLSLTDPAQKFLPGTMTVPTRGGKVITIEDLTMARSGLPRMPSNFKPASEGNPFIDYTDKEAAAFLNGHTLTRDIGSQYEYSNFGMGLLGYILTQVEKKNWEQVIVDNITKPLNMNHTYLSRPNNTYSPKAQGHDATGKAVEAWTWNDNSMMQGAGALLSDLEDMMKYMRAQMDEKSPIIVASKLTHTIRADAGRPGMDIGMGWHVRDKKYIWHNGGTYGFRTFVGFDPEKSRAVVVLTNAGTGADDLGFNWLDSKYELKKFKQPVAVDLAILQKYIGTYELTPEFKIAITLDGTQLQAQATNQPRFNLFGESDSKFFIKTIEAQVEFTKDAAGKVDKMKLYQGGAVQELKRLE